MPTAHDPLLAARRPTRSTLPASVDAEHATVRELVIELALVQHAMRHGPSHVDAADLAHRERTAVDQLRRRDLTLSCHQPISRPEH